VSKAFEVFAPAKLNLCLYVGPVRDDGLHELCSLFSPLSLADRLVVTPAERDEVVIDGIEGPDLTARALEALRESGWEHGPIRIEVEKVIPVAAGLGGGSADAAAVLRLARDEVAADRLAAIARRLGADVSSQLEPSFSLVGGAGERVEPLPAPHPFAAVLIPDPEGLSTPAVYAEADRLGTTRSDDRLVEARLGLIGAAGPGAHPLEYAELLVNDLAPAALSLRPSIGGALGLLAEVGAPIAIVTGSGPTAVGLFEGRDEAVAAATELRADGHEAIVASSVQGI
jgi:4-diphosphocytidyl-2-C-methyl-D-erythritol kinase